MYSNSKKNLLVTFLKTKETVSLFVQEGTDLHVTKV